jgi:hypothetical protein
MQENQLFEYAVIRVVPKVERDEFINVGIILYCKKENFLQTIFSLDGKRLQAFAPQLDIPELKEHLDAFEQIALGNPEAGPIGKLPAAERFRWLTATRSTMVQTSKVHPGLCTKAGDTLARLYGQLVL